jgi:DNA-binding IclR family transcriptional regulator
MSSSDKGDGVVNDDIDGRPRSLERTLDLLESVIASPQCTLTMAATATGLTPTTALRYLRALESRGYVDRDADGRFGAGPTVLRIAAILHNHGPLDRLIAAADSHLARLADATSESAYLVVSDGRSASYVATAAGPRAVRHVGWVGQSVPLVGSAAGDAFGHPGIVAVRTGAVEPDVTAMSLRVGTLGELSIALSVVGPSARFAGSAEHQRVLAAHATQLALDAGLEPSGHERRAS